MSAFVDASTAARRSAISRTSTKQAAEKDVELEAYSLLRSGSGGRRVGCLPLQSHAVSSLGKQARL
jgi:hypothetical protein